MTNDLTLLYVEDDEIIRENFTHIFKKYFQTVIVTDNGYDALKLYINNTIDVAILDISIPGLNGLHVAQEIRASDKKIEIIMLTGYSEKEKLIDAINTQIFAYLIKPVKREELNRTMISVIQKIQQNKMMPLSSDYNFDTEEKLLFYKGETIKLSKNEKKLISFLSENTTSYHSACSISNAIFETKIASNDLCNNIVQLISRFKKKMIALYGEENFFIDNIYGLGYKITN